MSEIVNKPKILYHFTSPVGLSAILRSRHISLTESNLNIREGNCGVVWLTSSPNAANHGLKFDNTIPVELDKTSIRISLPYQASFTHWDGWSDSKGMDKAYKEAHGACLCRCPRTYPRPDRRPARTGGLCSFAQPKV